MAAIGWETSVQLADSLFHTPPSYVTGARNLNKRLSRLSVSSPRTTRVCISSLDFEKKLKGDPDLQSEAKKMLEKAHSAESFFCLLRLFDFFGAKDNAVKADIEKEICAEFIEFSSPNEICIDATLRDDILENSANNKSNEANLEEVKKFILSELRFNKNLYSIAYQVE